MKKILFTLFLLLISNMYAQTPQGVNYQAVVKNSAGDPISNTTVALQFIIHENSTTGTALYSEVQSPTTTDTGLVTVILGQGTSTDDFSTIPWGTNTYFLEVRVDITGETNYVTLGTQQLLSVPYALHAKTTEIGDNLGNHTATQNIDLANNNIIGITSLATGTIISTAANAIIHTTTPNGNEGIIMPGATSDYIVSVQDGNGRIQHKWNASYGVNETYIKGNEDAVFIDITANVLNANEPWIEFKHADGFSSVAGDAISWETQLSINQGGRVGINETNPDDLLHITDGGNGTRVRTENTGNGWAGIVAKNNQREIFVGIQGAADANSGEFHIFDNTAGQRRLVIDAAGEVGIGRNNPSVKLDVNGFVNCTGGTCSSDERWKRNIATLPNVIENIKQMRGVSYFWKTEDFPDQNFTNDKQIGLIAQEVEKVYPELVKTNNEGFKSMDYMSLTAILLQAVKEQQTEIEDLKSINAAQLEENKALATRLSKIEAYLNIESAKISNTKK